MIKKIFLVMVFTVFLNSNAYAYLDPVTVTTVIQGVIGFIAAIILYIKNPKQIFIDLKKFLSKKKIKNEKSNKKR